MNPFKVIFDHGLFEKANELEKQKSKYPIHLKRLVSHFCVNRNSYPQRNRHNGMYISAGVHILSMYENVFF